MGQAPKWRTVDPIGLVTVREQGYLLATRSGADRTYRLSRILAAEELAEAAERPDRVDLDRAWRERSTRFRTGGDPVTVLVRVHAARREELVGTAVAVHAEEAGTDGRLRLEVTFQESRAHLGVETQRQWSEPAIARTTPVLMGLYSVTTLLAHEDLGTAPLPVRRAAWYDKQSATFSNTLAWVRQRFWPATINLTSHHGTDVVMIPRSLLERFTDTLAFAA